MKNDYFKEDDEITWRTKKMANLMISIVLCWYLVFGFTIVYKKMIEDS